MPDSTMLELTLAIIGNLVALYALHQTHFWQRASLTIKPKLARIEGREILGFQVIAGKVAAENVIVQCLVAGKPQPLAGVPADGQAFPIITSHSEVILSSLENTIRKAAVAVGRTEAAVVASGRNCHAKIRLRILPGRPIQRRRWGLLWRPVPTVTS